MTQGGPGVSSETFAVSMYKQTFVAGDYGVGSALAVLITVLTLVVSLLYLRRQLAGNQGHLRRCHDEIASVAGCSSCSG